MTSIQEKIIKPKLGLLARARAEWEAEHPRETPAVLEGRGEGSSADRHHPGGASDPRSGPG